MKELKITVEVDGLSGLYGSSRQLLDELKKYDDPFVKACALGLEPALEMFYYVAKLNSKKEEE